MPDKISQFREWKSGVKHCTFNPNGPGVVRIHLLPPKFSLFRRAPYIVILNGYYMLPLGQSWAIMLSAFMKEVNRFDGKPISEADEKDIYDKTVRATFKVYPATGKKQISEDLDEMLDILFAVARGERVDADIDRLSIRRYSENMSAPHRMDLMVSAMTDKCGKWQCNQRCLFCYAAGQEMSASHELSTKEWKSAIDKLRQVGVPMLTFTGGEPTLREDIAELVGYSKWFVTRLNTNGSALTEELAEKLREASLDSVQITLYSSDRDIHNKLVGVDGFDATVNGIRAAIKTGLDVSINTPLCTVNEDYISTLELVHKLGVRFVTVSGLICTGTASSNHESYDLTSERLYEIVEKAKKYCDENGMEIDFTSPGLIPSDKLEALGMNAPMCGAALSNMAIAPDGTVVPCQSWLNLSAGLGNILTDRFSDIWNSPLCKRLRKMNDDEARVCPFRMKRAEVTEDVGK